MSSNKSNSNDTNMSSNKSNSNDNNNNNNNNNNNSNSSSVNGDKDEENMRNVNANALANDAVAIQDKIDGMEDNVSVVVVGDTPLNLGGGDDDVVVGGETIIDKSGIKGLFHSQYKHVILTILTSYPHGLVTLLFL
jgi:hypothetical protein